ncbi:MAG: hypothetical protein K0Q87_2089 [Neobacillus sp.]|nr:hypothetical protein [Neobacillus sp.]
MSSILSSIITIFFTLPFLGLIIIYFLYKMITNDSRKSFHKALDYSTLLFIIAVHFLLITIIGKSFFWLILLIMILIAMVFVVVHWSVKGEIILYKVFKGFWRCNFLLFFIAYVSLTFYGLLHRAVTFSFFS